MAATITKETTPYTHIKIIGNKDSGTATSGGASTLTDTGKAWTVNGYAGRTVVIHTGTGAGQSRKVASNTATVLTVTVAWVTNPDNTSQYAVANNLADIQAANDAGSWAVMTTQGSQVRISHRIVLGDDTTANRAYLSDYSKQVEFAGNQIAAPLYWASTWCVVRDYSGVIFGEVLNHTDKTSKDGCSFYFTGTTLALSFTHSLDNGSASANPALSQFASCRFGSDGGARCIFSVTNPATGSYLWNIEATNKAEISAYTSDVYNITLQSSLYAFSRVTGEFNRAIASEIAGPAAYTHTTGEVAATFKNFVVRNCTYLFEIWTNCTIDQNLVNVDTDTWAMSYIGATSTAKLWIKYEVDITVKNTAGTPLQSIPVYMADSTSAIVVDPATITTDANGSITQQTLSHGYFVKASGQTETLRTPHTLKIRKYNYIFYQLTVTVAKKSDSTYQLSSNTFITQTTEATVAAYTGIAYTGGATKTVVLSSAHTSAELYDYLQYKGALAANFGDDEALSTTDGINLTLATGWKLTVLNYLTFGTRRISGGSLMFTTATSYSPKTGTTTLSFSAASGTYDLRNGDFTGTITLVNTGGGSITVQMPVGVTVVNTGPNITLDQSASVNIVISGFSTTSRLQLYDTNATTELYNDVPGATSKTLAVTYTADKPIRIRVADDGSAGADAMEFIETSQTLTSTGLSYAVTQVADTTYNSNAIDGSAVTGITITPSPARVAINIAGGSVTWPSIYAYQVYWLATATGIADEAAFIEAPDTANYILTNFDIKNTNANPLTITGGWGRDSVTLTVAGCMDVAGSTGNMYAQPDHIVAFATGSALTAGQAAELTAAAASAAAAASTATTIAGYTDTLEASMTRVSATLTNKHVLNPADGTVKVYDDAGVLLYSGLAYSDAAGTVLYNGTAAVHHTTRLT